MEGSPHRTLEEIVQKLQRDVNCLSDDNRTTRKRALDRLKRETVGRSPAHPPEVLQGLMEFLVKPLLRVLSDPVEKCRELAVGLLSDFAPIVQDIAVFLPYIVPVLVARLSTQEITEPSEELRLSLVSLLSSFIDLCSSNMAPYLSDTVSILQRTIVDPYPEVKKEEMRFKNHGNYCQFKERLLSQHYFSCMSLSWGRRAHHRRCCKLESCSCCIKLAEAIPMTFHQQSESLAKPLLTSMAHQHSRVRVACLKALGATVRYGSPNPINDALPALAQRTCDATPSVRSCLADVVGEWLLDLPDRYSHHHKLIPLLLTCVTDEVHEIRQKSHDLWEKVGAKYESENEEELKDQMDFTKPVQVAPHLEFPRPRLGCRVLVYRNFSKVLPAILRDIVDWTVNSRIKSSQLLHTLLYHLEDHATHHIQSILTGLYKACQDDESIVFEQAVKCSELIGFYVSPEVWCSLVLPAVRTSAGCRLSGTSMASPVAVGPVQCTSCLTVLAALMRGAKKEQIQPHLQAITECLAEPEVSQSEHLPLLRQLLHCVMAAIKVSGETLPQHSLRAFTVLLRIAASKHTEHLKPQVDDGYELLASTQGMESTLGLYEAHSKDILQEMKETYKCWSVHSPDCALFGSLLSGAGPVIGQLLDDIIPMLTSCLSPDTDPEMRLCFITLLIRLLLDAPSTVDSQQLFSQFASRVVSDIVLPNSIWKGGRTAAAIRTASMTCLQALLRGQLLTAQQLDQLLVDLLPKVVSCLDDDNQSTRLVSCKVMRLILLERPSTMDVDKLHSLYCDLLRRLDDSSDEVRLTLTKTLEAYTQAFPDDYSRDLYKAHTEALYKGLLIHLDDPSSEIQEAILSVLKQAARLNSTILRQQVEEVKHKHRTARYCNQLLEFLNDFQ